MNKKFCLGVVSILIILLVYGLPNTARIEECVDSILPWEIITDSVPKLAGYEVKEFIDPPGFETIFPENPYIWTSERKVEEGDKNVPGEFRSFSVSIRFCKRGRGIQGNGVTTNLSEEIIPLINILDEDLSSIYSREGTLIYAFAARGRFWITFIVLTDLEAEPFAERAQIEELIALVKERLL